MNILILAAGQAPLVPDVDYPLCLAEFDSVPLIQRVTKLCTGLNPSRLIVAFRASEISRYHLDKVVTLLWPDAVIVRVQEETRGAACTALLAAGMIDGDDELLIVNGNELLNTDFLAIVSDFRESELDAGTVVFDSIHPRYSYVRLDQHGLVVEASE